MTIEKPKKTKTPKEPVIREKGDDSGSSEEFNMDDTVIKEEKK